MISLQKFKKMVHKKQGPAGHPMAHGGAHWDVQFPDGTDHKNIRPKINKQTIASSSSSSQHASVNDVSTNDSNSSSSSYDQNTSVNDVSTNEAYTEALKDIVETYKNKDQINQQVDTVYQEQLGNLTPEEKQEMLDDMHEITSKISPDIQQHQNNETIKNIEQEALEEIIQRIKEEEENPTKDDSQASFDTLTQEEIEEFKKDLDEIFSKK